MWYNDIDDKALVIAAVTILCIIAMFKLPDAQNIVNTGIAGLLGVAVGKALNGR